MVCLVSVLQRVLTNTFEEDIRDSNGSERLNSQKGNWTIRKNQKNKAGCWFFDCEQWTSVDFIEGFWIVRQILNPQYNKNEYTIENSVGDKCSTYEKFVAAIKIIFNEIDSKKWEKGYSNLVVCNINHWEPEGFLNSMCSRTRILTDSQNKSKPERWFRILSETEEEYEGMKSDVLLPRYIVSSKSNASNESQEKNKLNSKKKIRWECK